MERHIQNTLALAVWLEAQPFVEKVNYPGLPGNKYNGLANKYLPKGAGGVLSFVLKADDSKTVKLVEHLELVSHLANVGDAKTLIIQPATTTHSQLSAEELKAAGIEPELEIAYNTYGKLNRTGDNVIWICHALTASSDVEAWWPGMVGEGLLFDPGKFFIVCANVLGSCYGTTGPASVNPETGKQWLRDFPLITIRDIVNVHEILRKHLKIKKIISIIGASIGGYQALEYSIMFPDLIQKLIILASGAKQTPWALAFSESMRLAMEADQTFTSGDPEGGKKGLKAARSVALISYRTIAAYNQTQKEDDDEKLTSFRAASYQAYQGEKLVRRFNPYSYWCLTCLSDTHNIGRGRGGILNALKLIKAEVLCVGIKSDLLFPTDEQKIIASNTRNAQYVEIDSFYGHDGFLVEKDLVTAVVRDFWEKPVNNLKDDRSRKFKDLQVCKII